MADKVLLTGVSGYLGGRLLARLDRAKLPKGCEIYALVRTQEQEESVRRYNAKPLLLDAGNVESLGKAIVKHEITIVFFLIDAMRSTAQLAMIRALSQVRQRTGRNVHFIHTSGAKIFSSHAGHPVDAPFQDTDRQVYDLQHTRKGRLALVNHVSERLQQRTCR